MRAVNLCTRLFSMTESQSLLIKSATANQEVSARNQRWSIDSVSQLQMRACSISRTSLSCFQSIFIQLPYLDKHVADYGRSGRCVNKTIFISLTFYVRWQKALDQNIRLSLLRGGESPLYITAFKNLSRGKHFESRIQEFIILNEVLRKHAVVLIWRKC